MPILASGSLDLLAVNPGLIFWTVVTFTIVLFILWRFAWKPIIDALDARNSKVEDDLKASEDFRKEAEELLKSYESKIDAAKHEVNELLEEARKDAAGLKARETENAQKDAAAIRERATADIEQAKLKAIEEVQEHAVEVALQLLSGVLKGKIPSDEHRSMVMNELEQLKSNN